MAVTPGRAPGNRERVIDAAVECILDLGYYRATSNEIARRAGFTWGVIQRQFGSREALMAAVCQDGLQQLLNTLTTARIEGESVRERIDSLYETIGSYYLQPRFLAYFQVLVNLRTDPGTSEDTLASLHRTLTALEAVVSQLLVEVAGDRDLSPSQTSLLYRAIHDHFVGVQIESVWALTETYSRRIEGIDAERQVLVSMLASMVEEPDGGTDRAAAPSIPVEG